MKSTKAQEAHKLHLQVVERIESQEGEPVAAALSRLYVGKQWNYDAIRAHWGISVSRLMRLMKECGVAARCPSEAVRLGKAKAAPQRRAASVVIARIEKLEAESVASALGRLYVEGRLSYRALCKRWKVTTHQLIRCMKEADIAPRERSEAVAQQWVDNPERRQSASVLLGEIARKQAAEGRHSNLGNTKEKAAPGRYDKFIASGHTLESRVKQACQRIKRHAENPASHPNAKVQPTQNEARMLDYCRTLGHEVIFNYPINGFWIDVYLPGLKVGIECASVGRRPSWARHQVLVGHGIHMLYVLNRVIETGELAHFETYLLALPVLRETAIFRLRDAMVWGTKRVSFFPDDPEGMKVEVITLKGSNCLRFSTEQ